MILSLSSFSLLLPIRNSLFASLSRFVPCSYFWNHTEDNFAAKNKKGLVNSQFKFLFELTLNRNENQPIHRNCLHEFFYLVDLVKILVIWYYCLSNKALKKKLPSWIQTWNRHLNWYRAGRAGSEKKKKISTLAFKAFEAGFLLSSSSVFLYPRSAPLWPRP